MQTLTTQCRTVGMDIGDKYIQLHVIEADGEVSQETRIPTKKKSVRTYFSQCPESRVAMEVGTHSRWISQIVGEFEHEVLVANPRKLRAIYENDSKTDRADARILAEIARAQPSLLRPIEHRGERAQGALGVLRSRDCLVSARTKLINHVRGTVKASGERLSKGSTDTFHKRIEEIPASCRGTLEPVMGLIGEMTTAIRLFERRIDELGKTAFPETQHLQQVPGVGPVTALAFVAGVEDPNRFPRSRKIGSWIGLRPRLDQSGRVDKQLRITKAGDGLLRRLLVGCGQYILGPFGPDSDLRRWGLELAARGGKNGKKRAVVAVARKLSVLLLTLWKTGAEYEPLRNENNSDAAVGAPKNPASEILKELLEPTNAC